MAFRLGDKSTGAAAESLKVGETSFVRDFIAIIVVRGLAKCLLHLVWSWIWCFIAVAVVSFRKAFVWVRWLRWTQVLTASPQRTSGAWESVIMDRAFSVMVWIMCSATPFLW